MLRQIPSKLLIEWMAFYGLEPFGYEANYQGHAMTSSVIFEVNRNAKKKKDPFTIADFMPKEEVEKESVFSKLKRYLTNVNSSKTSS